MAALLAVVLLCAACGDESGDETTETDGVAVSTSGSGSAPPDAGGSATEITLGISGVPPSQIMAGTSFRFVPAVSNPDGVALSFSGSNIPRWATLDAATGEVTGRPEQSDVGVYTNIRLTVSGGGASASTSAFSVEVVAVALGNATLSWVPPTEKTDGSVLDNLAGYRIYYGQSAEHLDQAVSVEGAGITSYTVQNLTPATWYFAATAYDGNGLESLPTATVSKSIF